MPRRNAVGATLTAREASVVEALRAGLSQRAGAAALGIGPRAYHKHVTRVYAFYGVHSQPELMALLAGDRPRREPTDIVLYGD